MAVTFITRSFTGPFNSDWIASAFRSILSADFA